MILSVSISKNLIKYLKILYKIPILFLFYWMPVSKTKSLHLLLIFDVVTILWLRLSIMLLMLQQQRLNYSLLDIESIKPSILITSYVSQSLLMLFIWPGRYSILPPITIVKDLRDFFQRNSNNSIVFLECVICKSTCPEITFPW